MGTMRAFMEGMRRGTRMTMDPQRAYALERERMRAREDTVTLAWESTGDLLRSAMDTQSQQPDQDRLIRR